LGDTWVMPDGICDTRPTPVLTTKSFQDLIYKEEKV
jgi:hypothetical protein